MKDSKFSVFNIEHQTFNHGKPFEFHPDKGFLGRAIHFGNFKGAFNYCSFIFCKFIYRNQCFIFLNILNFDIRFNCFNFGFDLFDIICIDSHSGICKIDGYEFYALQF
jgi:hypothetical protein